MTRQFRLTAPVPLEDALHSSVADALDLLLLPPATWATYPAGHIKLPPQAAAKLSRVGLKRGWPDILVLHRTLYGIELKRPGGRLSRARIVRTRRGAPRVLEGQTEVFPRLIAAGMEIATCETVDQVLATLAVWNIPLRTHR
jgi:hypothetical protein